MESMVAVEGVRLKTLHFCSVSLKEGEPPYCELPTASVEAGSTQSVSDGGLSSTLTYYIVGVVVLMLMMIFAVLVCIVTVSLYRRKKVRDRQLR